MLLVFLFIKNYGSVISNLSNQILHFSFKNVPQIRASRFIKRKALLVRGSRLTKQKSSEGTGMARGSSSSKKVDRESSRESNPEVTERKRLKSLAFANSVLSEAPAKAHAPLSPSKAVTKHHGKDVVKKSQRKNRFLFSFPGLLAPLGGGKIGELKDLRSKNPVLYLDFPQVPCFFLLLCLFPEKFEGEDNLLEFFFG